MSIANHALCYTVFVFHSIIYRRPFSIICFTRSPECYASPDIKMDIFDIPGSLDYHGNRANLVWPQNKQSLMKTNVQTQVGRIAFSACVIGHAREGGTRGCDL